MKVFIVSKIVLIDGYNEICQYTKYTKYTDRISQSAGSDIGPIKDTIDGRVIFLIIQ